MHFSLKGDDTSNVPSQWFIGYGQMEIDAHNVYPEFSWETPIHCRHRNLPEGSALFFRWNNVDHPDMLRTLSILVFHCCNHIYVSCDGFHYCKSISRVSANHMVQGSITRKSCLKMVWYPSSNDHRHHVGSIPDGSGCRTCIQTVTCMWAPATFPLNMSFAEGR